MHKGSGVLVHQNVVKSTYGQLVIGPPGSGKTTYCTEMWKLLNDDLKRKTIVINLDPANDNVTYDAKIDIKHLITVEDVMKHFDLGPNGALMYCVEYLEKNVDWLLEKLNTFRDYYWLIDMPGQVELYTHHKSLKNIFRKFERLEYHLTSVHIIDAHYCSDPTKFISTVLLSLSTMLQLELPHINVFSKADLLAQHSDQLQFGVEFYTEVLNLEYLLECLDGDQFSKRYKHLNAQLIGLIEDFSLVSFMLMNVNSKTDLIKVKNAADKANGYVYGSNEERNIQSLLSVAVGARTEPERYDIFDV